MLALDRVEVNAEGNGSLAYEEGRAAGWRESRVKCDEAQKGLSTGLLKTVAEG